MPRFLGASVEALTSGFAFGLGPRFFGSAVTASTAVVSGFAFGFGPRFLGSAGIAGAALDVFPSEPYSGKLCELPNVVLTPHVGGSTKEAQSRIGQELVAKLREELG